MMCCDGADWKNEHQVDYKFDYIDLEEYYSKSVSLRLKYLTIYAAILRGIFIYLSDIASVVLQFIISDNVNDRVKYDGTDIYLRTMKEVLGVAKYVYLVCVVLSIFLLIVDVRKARRIIRSSDIAFAFTSVIAYRWYSVKSYLYYCFFEQIQMTKTIDRIALFVFFRLKNWKRLLFAELPRNGINIMFLIFLYREDNRFLFYKGNSFSDNFKTTANILVTLSTSIFLLSFVGTFIALLLYFPLICHIQGNLKEYTCHKIDKRIAKLIAKKDQRKAQNIRLKEFQERQRMQYASPNNPNLPPPVLQPYQSPPSSYRSDPRSNDAFMVIESEEIYEYDMYGRPVNRYVQDIREDDTVSYMSYGNSANVSRSSTRFGNERYFR